MKNMKDQYLNYFHKSLFNTVFVFLSVKGKYDADELVGLSGEVMIANLGRDNKFSILEKKKITYDKDLVNVLKGKYSDMFQHLREIAETEVDIFYLKQYYIKGIEKPKDVDLRYKFILKGISLSVLNFLEGYIYLPKKNIEVYFKDSQSEELQKFINKVYMYKRCIKVSN